MARQPDIIAELYRTALPRLGAYAFLLTGNYAEAEDLVQAAIVKVCARPRKFPDAASAEGYVRAAIRTLHVDAMRRQARWRRAVPRLASPDALPSSAEALAQSDAVASALATLAPRVRATVAMYYWDDLSVKEIAGEMGVSDGTIKGYLQDGRRALAPLLGEDRDEDRTPVKEPRS